jgi:hypothetical protein
MKFHPTPEDEIDRRRYPTTLQEWRSEGGHWVVHVNRVFFGLRVNLGPEGDRYDHGYELDYCAGTDRAALLLLPRLIIAALDNVPEAVGCDWIRRRFPRQARKPIANDPACWARLCELAGVPDLADHYACASEVS